jgi:hypothetical protein
MSVNEKLVGAARAAGAKLAGAEHEVQLARAEYHAIVRRMHLAGCSLREIAEMLGLSHQRVQQMVQGAGGSWWRRIWRQRNLKGNPICTFCRRPQGEVAKLIAGPKVYICDICVATAEQSMTPSPAPALPGSLAPAKEGSKARCSFCRKGRTADRSLFTGSAGNLCGECLSVCRQILTDSSV